MSDNLSLKQSDDVSIILAGPAGLGIQTVEFLLTRILKLSGYNVFAAKEYMSRVRGGTNSTEVRIASRPVRAFADKIDILIPLDKAAVRRIEKRITPQTIILSEGLGDDFDRTKCRFFDVPFTKKASEIGDKVYSNVVAAGTIASLFDIERQVISDYVKKFFSAKSDAIIRNNLAAVEAGYQLGLDLRQTKKIEINIARDQGVKDQLLLSGAEAVSLGAIAGGCNFIAAYPMSPSTGVLTFLAKHSKDFGIIAEQAEDEIAAVNMAVGAWYAGARALASTSGGGFALMTEGLSLAAMLESPIVIHLAQRPGPATGLPTRTEQADLELALYAGHGEFPRIIFSPGKIEDAFYLTQKAFNLADKYQVPVFLLTDQYLIDSYYNIPSLDLSKIKIEEHIVKTEPDYRRYQITEDGVSPRGIPGLGKGLVCVDSDEHDQDGHITEDLDLRIRMVDKRLRKLDAIKNETIPPVLFGPVHYKTLIICWGSTCNIVDEAVRNLARDDLAFLHFSQVYPLHSKTIDYLQKAEETIIIEGNATGQFGKLIKLYTGFEIGHKILKYSGLNFTVEEVEEGLKKILD